MKLKRFFSVENLTLLGITLGICGGLFFPNVMLKLELIGKLFLKLLKFVIAPLIFSSIFVSVTSLSSFKEVRSLGVATMIYYLTTTALAVGLGLLLVFFLHPGANFHFLTSKQVKVVSPHFSVESFVLNIVPDDLFKSLVNSRALQLIFSAILLGLAALSLPEEKRNCFCKVTQDAYEIFLKVTTWIIWITPLGVFSLVGVIVAKVGLKVFLALGEYAFTVILGLTIHAFGTLFILGWLLGGYNPVKFMSKVKEALLLAFSTASSAATLPVSLKVATEKAKIPKKIAGFVLPLGATVNMDGTALYEAVAALFIANIYGVKLSTAGILTVFLTATFASIGAAAIPGAGLVMLTLVLSSVGIPVEGIGIILTVDRFLDMLRTSVNVWGDLTGSKILSRFI